MFKWDRNIFLFYVELGDLWLNVSLSGLFHVIMNKECRQKMKKIDCELLTNAMGLT